MARFLGSNKVARSASNPKRITMDDLLRRWGKFDEAELAAIRNNEDLVAQIQARYGLEKQQAQTNVDLWAKGRTL
jgi:hypothetical protein